MLQWPALSSRSAENTLGPSKRGPGHQTSVPSRSTSAAVRQSLSRAWSAMGAANSGAFLHGDVGLLEEVRHGLRGVDGGEEPGRARRGHEPAGECRGDPLREAVRADRELPDGEPHSGPARLLLDLAGGSGLLVARERGAQEARDLVLGEQAAELVGGDAGERDVSERVALGELAAGGAQAEQRAGERSAERAGQDRVGAERAVLGRGGSRERAVALEA